jgi:hypothetical protein
MQHQNKTSEGERPSICKLLKLKRAMAKNELEKLNQERNRLNKMIREKNAEIEKLEVKIADLETLRKERNDLSKEVEQLTKSKAKTQEFINEKAGIEDQIATLNGVKSNLDGEVNELVPKKESLSIEVQTLKDQTQELSTTKSDLETSKSNLIAEIEALKIEKSKMETHMTDLRTKYGLYSKDMADMSIDSNKQLYTYAIASGATIIISISLMITLLCILVGSDPYTAKLLTFYENEPNLRFLSILAIRISISAVFIFLIIVFLNLTRSFVSQFIKTRNRLTALRVADFLIGKLDLKNGDETEAEELVNVKREILKEQIELLKVHIPKIMDLNSSSFDKIQKEKDPIEMMKEFKEIFKT